MTYHLPAHIIRIGGHSSGITPNGLLHPREAVGPRNLVTPTELTLLTLDADRESIFYCSSPRRITPIQSSFHSKAFFKIFTIVTTLFVM
jgi:hypothetical protein